MLQSLEYQIAEKQVHDFDNEVMEMHQAAMECLDCEEFIAKGIAAYDWLVRADQTLRDAAYAGFIPYSPEIKSAIEGLYTLWLRPCATVATWVEKLEVKGQRPANLNRLLECKEAVTETIQRQALAGTGSKGRLRRFAEEARQ